MASRVLPSDAYTYEICGGGNSMSWVGRLSNASALAFAARPDMATMGKAAAATTIPASRPQINNDAALVSTP
jgi:hypothetical protein